MRTSPTSSAPAYVTLAGLTHMVNPKVLAPALAAMLAPEASPTAAAPVAV